MSDAPPSAQPPAQPPAGAVSALQRHAARMIVAICIVAMLLPASAFPEHLPYVQHTIVLTSSTTGIVNSLCSMVVEYAGKVDQLQYLCLPMGLTAGSVAAAVSQA